jgi:AraC-like DNA-binding protein
LTESSGPTVDSRRDGIVRVVLRAEFEHVEALPAMSWKSFRRREERFAFTWHFHPEYELTLITEGSGTLFAGDTIEEYAAGDLVLIGPDLPHTYASTPDRPAHEAVVAQFRGDFLGTEAFRVPELAPVATLLDRARRGLRFPRAVDVGVFATLDRLPPPEQTLTLLSTLVRLSAVPEARPLASAHYSPTLNRSAHDRTTAVIRFLQAEYGRPVGLEDVARAAHLSPAAVSRLFRRTTGTTITAYLNTLRVNAACRLLVETDRRIADVAADCGYQNLSHFNRRFRRLKGMSPREYRARFETTAT